MSSYDPYVEVTQALQLYFDGIYEGDSAKLAQIFHPSCTLYAAPDEGLTSIPMDRYLKSIEERPSPRSQGNQRHDAILSATVTNEGSAVAVLRTARLPRMYTEFMTLLRIDGRWQIISKVYSWILVPEEQ